METVQSKKGQEQEKCQGNGAMDPLDVIQLWQKNTAPTPVIGVVNPKTRNPCQNY
jgi:hypothetical protein